jgi:hypothetical protein
VSYPERVIRRIIMYPAYGRKSDGARKKSGRLCAGVPVLAV